MVAPMSEPSPPITDLSFEDALRALEDVVRRLESGDVPLDESIALYERGEALRKTHGLTLDGLGQVEIMVAAEHADEARRLLAGVERGDFTLDDSVEF